MILPWELNWGGRAFAALDNRNQIRAPDRHREREEFSVTEAATSAGRSGLRADEVLELLEAFAVELRVVAANSGHLLLEGFGNVDDETSGPVALLRVERKRRVN